MNKFQTQDVFMYAILAAFVVLLAAFIALAVVGIA